MMDDSAAGAEAQIAGTIERLKATTDAELPKALGDELGRAGEGAKALVDAIVHEAESDPRLRTGLEVFVAAMRREAEAQAAAQAGPGLGGAGDGGFGEDARGETGADASGAPKQERAEEPEPTGWRKLARDFAMDVYGERTSVSSFFGWLLTALFVLIYVLTAQFAANVENPTEAKEISVSAGYLTIAIIALIALAAALQPQIQLLADRISPPRIGGGSRKRRGIGGVFIGAALFVWRLPGRFWSLVDYLLARPLAWLAGAAAKDPITRYGIGAATLVICFGVGLYAEPWIALIAICYTLIALLAVVRRWGWVESDRNVFIVERGVKPGSMRIGHEQDLRDEALIGLIALFALIPLGLMQVHLLTEAAGEPAFLIKPGQPELTGQRVADFLTWLGFFGAELAKSAPFVDWSEVYRVGNGSPIDARTELGATLVFLLRASLDLLLLAAVVQAVQIAARLRDQFAAFARGRLDLLEPFEERRWFARVMRGLRPELETPAATQSALDLVPAYDARRLAEILQDGTGSRDAGLERQVKKAAAALLQRRHRSEATDKVLTERARAETDPELREWLEAVGAHLPLAPQEPGGAAHRAALRTLLLDRDAAPELRAAAARGLGRRAPAEAERELLLSRLTDQREAASVRVDCGVALAKGQVAEAQRALEALAESFTEATPGEPIAAAMATAYGLAQFTAAETAEALEAIAGRFRPELRDFARRAARIQRDPWGAEASSAAARDGSGAWDQMAALPAGRFDMGSSEDRDHPQHSPFPYERPLREGVEIRSPFALGRFPVSQEEYLAFCLATGGHEIPRQGDWVFGARDGSRRWAAMQLSWWDAVAYCDWLSRITGMRYRLPTEAEWEYACRAGTNTTYSWGAEYDPAKASSSRSGLSQPEPLGNYEPNEWGLFEMHGTVAEWCADPWTDDYRGAPKDERVNTRNADLSRAVLRGGSWNDPPEHLRSANRYRFGRDDRDGLVGFRVARTHVE